MMQFRHQVKCYHFSIVKIIAERVSLIQMSNIIKKLFYSVLQTNIKWDVIISPSSRLLLKCEFNTDFKIELKSITSWWRAINFLLNSILIKAHTIRKEECFCNLRIAWIPIYLTKTMLRQKSNATFSMKGVELDELQLNR